MADMWGMDAGEEAIIAPQIPEVDPNELAPPGMSLFSRRTVGRCTVCDNLKRMPKVLDMLNFLTTVYVCQLNEPDEIVAVKVSEMCIRELEKRKQARQVVESFSIEAMTRHVSHMQNTKITSCKFYRHTSDLFYLKLSTSAGEDGDIEKDNVAMLEKLCNMALRWHPEAVKAEEWAVKQTSFINTEIGRVTTMDIDV